MRSNSGQIGVDCVRCRHFGPMVLGRALFSLLPANIVQRPSWKSGGDSMNIQDKTSQGIQYQFNRSLATTPSSLRISLGEHQLANTSHGSFLVGGRCANNAMSTHTVCEGVVGPEPASSGFSYISSLSPYPPSVFWTDLSQRSTGSANSET